MKKLVPALLLLTLLAACKKDENISMRTRIITSGTWKISDIRSIISTPDSTIESSLLSLYPAAFQDNRYRFFSNGDYVTLEGPLKLNPVLPDSSKTGTWKFSTADTKIIFSDTSVFDIQMLNDTQMVFSNTSKSDDGKSSATGTFVYHR